MGGGLSADTIARAALVDPQLRVPKRPRLRRGLVTEVQSDQLVVTGIPSRQLFRGKSAVALLPQLLAALDGERDHAELASQVGTSQANVFKALSLLWTCGVIEEAAPDDVGHLSDVPDRLADWLSRIGDSTGANSTWEEAAARLASAQVEVAGDPTLADVIVAELEPPLPVRRSASPQPSGGVTLFVLVERDGAPDADARQAAAACWDRRVPLLRVRLSGSILDVGPYVLRGTTACLDCQTSRSPVQDSGDEVDPKTNSPVDVGLAGALAARDIFSLVSRSTPVVLPVRWRRTDLQRFSATDVAAPTRPGCRRCSAAAATSTVAPPLSAQFESSVSIPPRHFADPKAHQAHYKPSNMALQRSFRSWPLSAKVQLPQADPDRLSRVNEAAPLDVETLSLLLAVTAGIKTVSDAKVSRWTAAGGNIGSVTAYLAVRRCLGLASGLYAYVIETHQLALLDDDPLLPGESDATLVLTGDYRKVAQKYAAFALRIVLLDGGCAQASLRRASSALAVPISMRTAWDDELIAAALRVEPDVEPLTAVADLGAGHDLSA